MVTHDMMVPLRITKNQQPLRDSIICSMLESIESRENKLLPASWNNLCRSEELMGSESVDFQLASNLVSDKNQDSSNASSSEDKEDADGCEEKERPQTPRWGSNRKD